MKKAVLEVLLLDNYNPDAAYQIDFLSPECDQECKVVFCSHGIENQRDVGFSLDRILTL